MHELSNRSIVNRSRRRPMWHCFFRIVNLINRAVKMHHVTSKTTKKNLNCISWKPILTSTTSRNPDIWSCGQKLAKCHSRSCTNSGRNWTFPIFRWSKNTIVRHLSSQVDMVYYYHWWNFVVKLEITWWFISKHKSDSWNITTTSYLVVFSYQKLNGKFSS